MAGSDLFTQLSKKSPAYKLGLLAGLMVISGLLYYTFIYADMSEQLVGLENRQNQLLRRQKQLDKDLEEKRRLAKVKEELEQSIRDSQRALPTEAELPAFFDHLQRKAGDASVSIRKWERLKEQEVDIYVRVPVRVEVGGTFLNIMKYFYLLGPPQRTATQDEDAVLRIDERIVSVEDLELRDPVVRDGEVLLTAEFIASTFRQAGALQTGAASGQPGRAKGKPGGKR